MRNLLQTGLAVAVLLSMFVAAPALTAGDPPVEIVDLTSNNGERGSCSTENYFLYDGVYLYTCYYVGQQLDGTCVYACFLET